jgi:hypothetical protein
LPEAQVASHPPVEDEVAVTTDGPEVESVAGSGQSAAAVETARALGDDATKSAAPYAKEL